MLAFFAISCNKDSISIEDQLIGKWILTDKTVSDIPAILSECEKLSTIEFRGNNYCLLYDACADDTTHSGWNYKYEMLNISEHLPAAYYIDQLDDTSLIVSRKDISSAGDLEVTVLSYVKKTE
jgi:hypothetical protein